MSTGVTGFAKKALKYRCFRCGAKKGKYCISSTGKAMKNRMHTDRIVMLPFPKGENNLTKLMRQRVM